MIGIWKIGPANGAADNQIASDQKVFSREIVADMTRRMAGSVDDRYIQGAELEFLVVGYVSISAEGRNHKRQTEHADLDVRMLRLGFIQLMDEYFGGRRMLFHDCM